MTATPSAPSSRTRLPPGVSAEAWEHPVSVYARDCLANRLPAGPMGKWVKRACRRHLRDLVRAPAKGWWFDTAAADRIVAFFLRLRHTKGSQWAGRPVVLAPWQVFVSGSLAGWKRWNPEMQLWVRRFDEAYIESGKKSGKSTWAAGMAIYFTFFDDPNETGAEGYTAATKKEQARYVWDEAREMVNVSPGFRRYIHIWGGRGPKSSGALTCDERRQRLVPLSKDSRGLEGVNPHFVVLDELHQHEDRKVYDIVTSSHDTRPQPLVLSITNSGFDESTVCWEVHARGMKVLDGAVDNDSFFVFICGIDKGDSWRDEKKWCKANPGLGFTFPLEKVRTKFEKALAAPGSVNAFRRYSCGEWLAVDELAIDMDRWKSCGRHVPLLSLRRRPCRAGMDLSSTVDPASVALYFPPEKEKGDAFVLVRTYVPKDTLVERQQREGLDWVDWVKRGLVIATPGSSIDYAFIRADVQRLARLFDIRAIGFDRYQANETRTILEDEGFLLVEIPQGHKSLAGPTRTMEALYMEGRLRHGGNPVLTWMASNVVWRVNENGDYVPDKGDAQSKKKHIDGISALVTAMATLDLEEAPPPPPAAFVAEF